MLLYSLPSQPTGWTTTHSLVIHPTDTTCVKHAQNEEDWSYLTSPVDADSVVLGVTAEGTILSRHQQLTLSIRGRTLQVTRLTGDADVIRCKKNTDVFHFLDLLMSRNSIQLPQVQLSGLTHLDKVGSTGNIFCQKLLH